MKRAAILLLVGATACGGADPTRDAIGRGVRFLWEQQAADGGWHSDTYGLLRSGQSLSAFVLATLADLPGEFAPADPDAIARAVDFLARNTDHAGCLGLADELVPDYPNYATALAAQALESLGVRDDLRDRMLRHLHTQQFTEAGGWTPDHPAHGSWGMGGEPRTHPHHGHIDLSMSRHVMEALASAGDTATRERALRFLDRCQNEDGGFVFTPLPALAGSNKAGPDGEGWRSYGTTTADGILGMLAMGVSDSDPRVGRAADWLVRHHRVNRVPGFGDGKPGGWADGLRFYYLAASSRALSELGIDQAPEGSDWRRVLNEQTLMLQAADGSWRNWSSLVKEDDPLITTCLALRALAATLR